MGHPGRTHPLHTPNWDGHRLDSAQIAGARKTNRHDHACRRYTTLPVSPSLLSPTNAPRAGWSPVMRPKAIWVSRARILPRLSPLHHITSFFSVHTNPSRHRHQSSVRPALTSRTYALVSSSFVFLVFFFLGKPFGMVHTYRTVCSLFVFVFFIISVGLSIYLPIYLYLTCTVNIPLPILTWSASSHL